MTSRRWQRLFVLLVAFAALLLNGCTSSTSHAGPCHATCTGSIGAARYLIKMPHHWNGTLLIYSHGYRFAGTPPLPSLSPQDTNGTGDDPLSTALLDKGYALAASSWSSDGWAVQDGVHSADQLYQRFVDTFRKPTRVYAWGSSLGGLVSEQLAERANWVDGAAPMCGVVGGPLVNFDNWLEAAVAAEALLGVKLTLTGTLSPDQAKAESGELNTAILAARGDTGGDGAAKLVYLADLAGLPGKSSLFSKDGRANEIGAAAQNFAFYLHTGLKFLAEARDQFGGNPAMTHPASKAPLRSDQRAAIAALHGNADTFAAEVDAADPPPTSSAARQRLAATGEPTGNLGVPTITLHGVADPLAIAANETVLRSLVAARDRTNRLEQLFVGPYGQAPTFGLGHCYFSTGEVVGLIEALDQWVRHGARPAQTEIDSFLGPALYRSYSSPKWPSGVVD